MPLDKETVFDSVKKTNKVIVLYEATRSGGVGAEVAALISEEVFNYLDGPILRISAPDTPVPYSPPMEEYYLPQVEDVVEAAEKLAAY
jgi:2-oxoisovalerate dehydrogenase E1 component beta subunit